MKLKQSKENNVAVDNVDHKRILEIICSRCVLAMTSDKPIMLGTATYLTTNYVLNCKNFRMKLKQSKENNDAVI